MATFKTLKDTTPRDRARTLRREDTAAHAALMRAPERADCRELGEKGIKAMLRVPFRADGLSCDFCCESRSPRDPDLELHAAAELFAQMFAMRLAIDKAANP